MSAEPWTHHVTLPAFPPSAGAARAFVTAQLRRHSLTEEIWAIELVTSELATNAIQHAQTRFTVHIQGNLTEVRVDVRDGDPQMGTFLPPVQRSPGGQGLFLTEALSDSWGVDHEPSGKSVWAQFTVATAPAHA